VALGLIAVLMVAAACGSPDGDAPEFVYTPVPYTVIPAQTRVPSYIVSERDGEVYQADKVLVAVAKEQREEFTEWLDDVGFGVGQIIDTPGADLPIVTVVVHVPPGSAPDAVEFIRPQLGVREVGLSWFLGD
jgi:hypothetical protein